MASIIDEITQILDRWAQKGITRVYLNPKTKEALFTQKTSPQDKTTTAYSSQTVEAQKASAQVDKQETSEKQQAESTETTAVKTRQSSPQTSTVKNATASSELPGELKDLKAQAEHCTQCNLSRGRTNVVFGEGTTSADLMFIGEAPAKDEDEAGRPFVGEAGQKLTDMIAAMQFSRDDVYIANIIKCRPPGNRNPSDQEAQTCLPYLQKQIAFVQPKILVLLGAVPLRFLLGKTGLMEKHGQWFEYNGTPVIPTFHPAFLLRSPDRRRDTWEDLQKAMKYLGKDPQETLRQMRQKG